MATNKEVRATLTCFALGVAALLGAARQDATALEPLATWQVTLVDIEGREIRPFDDPKCKALALIFLLPDCPIGNSYLPELQRLHETFAPRGIQMVCVQADSETSLERAKEHARDYQLAMPVVLDPKHKWVKKAGATMAPEAAVFSRSGELLYRGRIDNQYAGLGQRRAVVTERELKDAVEAIVAGRPVSRPRTEAVGCLIPELPSGK